MKFIITGHKHHGKNTVCDLLAPFMTSIDSSRWACENFLFEEFQKQGILYDSVELCHRDRVNNRQLWYETIRDWNGDRPQRLAEALFMDVDIYNGLRHRDEWDAIKKTLEVDALIWVDASERLPPESSASMTVTADDADYIIDNNGLKSDLVWEIRNVLEAMADRRVLRRSVSGEREKVRMINADATSLLMQYRNYYFTKDIDYQHDGR